MGSGRIVCPRCGANNFDTVTQCWKCSAPLSAGAAPMTQTASRAQPAAAAADRYPIAPPVVSALDGDPGAASRAAFWLGILMPYFGFPVGLAFIMSQERRRQQVGRLCLVWSAISSVIHLLLLVVALLGMREYFLMAVKAAASANRGGGIDGF